MHQIKQNRGAGIAPVSREQLGGWSQNVTTLTDRQAQLFTSRFRVTHSVAHDMARLCFGEIAND